MRFLKRVPACRGRFLSSRRFRAIKAAKRKLISPSRLGRRHAREASAPVRKAQENGARKLAGNLRGELEKIWRCYACAGCVALSAKNEAVANSKYCADELAVGAIWKRLKGLESHRGK